MRKKSIRKNKSNRKKTYRKEKYHKKTNRRKTNLKRTNHKKTKHKKTYLKKINIQRGGSDDEVDTGEMDFNSPEMTQALLEEMEENEEQLQLAAEFGQTLLEKTEELEEELDAIKREKETAITSAEEAEYRVRELEESLKKLTEARKEEIDTAVSNAREEGKILGYEAEKSRNEGRLEEILESVNELGSVTEGESYIQKSDTEDIESTLKSIASVIEEKINQQIRLGTAEATQSLMEAQTKQAMLDERIEELEKEVDEARETRDNAKREKESAMRSLKAEESKNLELITRNQEVVREHVADKEVLREKNRLYESQNEVYRENNTELKAQNEKLSTNLAVKEDCIEKTKRALEGNSAAEDDDLE